LWRKQGKVATKRSRLSGQDAEPESGAGVERRTGLFLPDIHLPWGICPNGDNPVPDSPVAASVD
jgi:hypothetical protein